MARILITGASGLLGANLLRAAAFHHELMGVVHRFRVRLPGVEILSADLSRPGQAQEICDRFQPEIVFHCAAATDVDGCERDPDFAFRLNRDMAGYVAVAARSCAARLVHISTDAVFDGRQAGVTEDDAPNPLSVYGRSKLEGEQAVLQAHPQALIVRTNFYGWNVQPKYSLAEWFLARLEAGEPCGGFVDVQFRPLLVGDLIEACFSLLAKEAMGIYHVLGGECLSKYEFGLAVAQAFELDQSLISPIKVADLSLPAPRSKNLCLDTGKVEAILDWELPGIKHSLGLFARSLRYGSLADLRAMAEEL